MKKRLLGLFLAITCLLMPILTSCGDGSDYVATAKLKPMTITLYGITGENTTEEAILEVQNELNEYTEGNLSIRVLLRLYTEDVYYEKLNEAIGKAQEYKANEKNKDEEVEGSDTTAAESTTEEKSSAADRFEVKFEDEKGTQVDIFMVRGADKLQEYVADGIASPVKVEEKNGIISKYISSRYLALASKGTPTTNGNVDSKATLYGIPCNYVVGDYTYLLVNKEIASNYGYASQDLDTLDELAIFLDDAATDYSDYITLYNAPELNVETIGNTLIGATIPNDAHSFSFVQPGNLFADKDFVNLQKNLKLYEQNGYLTEGDYYALPADEKVAAAFIKGNAALPEEYEDDYIVIPYAKPCVEDIGTVFCVSTLTTNVARCLEVVSAIMTNVEYRNTLQYGVENKHYKINDYTHELEIISEDYSMNYADTGNMFILKPNTSMSAEMLALAANNWELAKQQYRDATINPYTTPYQKFALKYYDETNYTTSAWYANNYESSMAAIVAEFDDYKTGLEKALEEAQAKVDAENQKNKDKEGWVDKVVDVEKETADFTKDFIKDYVSADGMWYESVLKNKVESDVATMFADQGTLSSAYEAEKSKENFDLETWYKGIISGKTKYNVITVIKDKAAYSAALKAAKAEGGKDFKEADFLKEYTVDVDIDDILASGKAYNEAYNTAKAEAEANGGKFDEEAFIAEYIAPTVKEIKEKHTFEYTPGYTEDNIKAIEELTEQYLAKLMDYDPASGLTFEEHAESVAAEYLAEEKVNLMLDSTSGDSVVAQYIAWATGLGIYTAPAA